MENTQLTAHLLPTEDASILCIIDGGLVYAQYGKKIFGVGSIKGTVNQHLYICATLPIKEGDWVINIQHNSILKCHHSEDKVTMNIMKCYKKIEFTTDPKLFDKAYCDGWASNVPAIDGNTKAYVEYKKYIYTDRNKYELGLLEVNFLEEYCNRYNQKDKIIKRKTIQECKDEIAKLYGYKDFADVLQNCETRMIKVEQAMELYANQTHNQKGVDVEKLTSSETPRELLYSKGFTEGYNQAIQSNAGGFSLEDMVNAYKEGVDFAEAHPNGEYSLDYYKKIFDRFIQSLTKEQPKGDIIIECEMEEVDGISLGTSVTKIKLDSKGQPILIFK